MSLDRRRWISTGEAAEILNVDPATVRLWAKRFLDGESSRLRQAKLFEGRFYLSRREIQTILERGKPL